MADPISLVIVGAVAGGAAGEVVKMGIQSGQIWLRERFASHQAKIAESANRNANDFLNRLAQKVDKLEEENSINRSVVDSVLEDPSYSILLQKSMLSAAEQSSSKKHELLSRIVSERIRHKEEDLYSLCAPLAVEAISRCTSDQMKMLAILTYMFNLSHPKDLPEPQRANIFYSVIRPLLDISPKQIDILHLESTSCLSFSGIQNYSAEKLIDPKFSSTEKTWEILPKYGDRNSFEKIWSPHLNHCFPTSVGQLVGITALDELRGQRTDLSIWGK